MTNQHAYFQVSLKALIIKDKRVLTLISPDKKFDFPGGRISEEEVELDFRLTLEREIKEELSDNFKFEIGQPIFFSKRKYFKNSSQYNVIAIFFTTAATNSEISLSDEHESYRWMSFNELLKSAENFVSEDEYNKLKDYLTFL